MMGYSKENPIITRDKDERRVMVRFDTSTINNNIINNITTSNKKIRALARRILVLVYHLYQHKADRDPLTFFDSIRCNRMHFGDAFAFSCPNRRHSLCRNGS